MERSAHTVNHERLVRPGDFASAPTAARPAQGSDGNVPLPWSSHPHAHQPEPAWLNWPAMAVVRVRVAAQALNAIADQRLVVEGRSRYSEPEQGDADRPVQFVTGVGAGVSPAIPDAVLVEVRDVTHAMDKLSQEFGHVCTWLADATKSGWEATGLERPPRGVASVLCEPHRIIVQDWFLTDTSYLIGWLLHRVARQLQSLDAGQSMAPGSPPQSRSCADVLGHAAEMLERAAALAAECIFFAEQSRLRWLALREQVDRALGESRQVDPDGPSMPAPLYEFERTWR
jgi:hypothetical protein